MMLVSTSPTEREKFKSIDEISARFASNWNSLVRVIAIILRLSNITIKRPTSTRFITPAEFTRAEQLMFKKIQHETFEKEFELIEKGRSNLSRLAKLSPVIINGLIRMSSRAQHADTSYDAKNPIILPNKNLFVEVFIKHHHEKNMHQGEEMTVADVRQKAWVLEARAAVKRVKRNCQECKNRQARPKLPIMGQLPAARLDFGALPFTHVGLDAFGPYKVKFGRGSVKRYGIIFTCLTYRAVHLELLENLTTEACLMSIKSFLARRGGSLHFYSDNGKNFVGASNVLTDQFATIAQGLSERIANHHHILWHFIPVHSPWFGGAWERLIQSIKKCIDFVMHEESPHESVFRNALIEAETWMNKRPLTHVPIDHVDAPPLTPNHVLFGDTQDRQATMENVFRASQSFNSNVTRGTQHLVNKFHSRWVKEYLPLISKRDKWIERTKPVEVGDVAILIEPSVGKEGWKKCKVVATHPGADGYVRAVDVQLADKSIKKSRSVGRIAILDVKSSVPVELQTGRTMSPSSNSASKD